ncbi:MAG: arylesterase [Gemmatimonadota bacterium]|nr:arylesterase [Gemmatimonadota bacterium]
MRIWRGIIVGAAFAGLLTACAGERPAQRPAPPAGETAASANESPDRPTIVFLGTSLTAGYGLPTPDSAYPAVVQQLLDSVGLRYTVVNAGVSGESSAGALRRVDWVLKARPAFLVVETGANDGLRGQDPDSVRANIQAMIDRGRTQSPDTRIVLAGMEALPNLGQDYVRRFRAVFPALAKANRLPLIPFLLQDVAGVDSLNQDDGIHPNNRGARLAAHNVWRTLEPLLR